MGTYVKVYSDELAHHGIKGMKWGVRRFQTKDGGLTAAGRKRYSDGSELGNRVKAGAYKLAAKNYELNEKTYAKGKSRQAKLLSSMNKSAKNDMLKKSAKYQEQADKIKAQKQADKEAKKAEKQLTPEERRARTQKALKVGAAVAGTALAAYGAYKIHEAVRDKNFELRMNQGRQNVDKILSSGITDTYRGMPTDDLIRAHRLEHEIIEKTISRAAERARSDSFSTAAKNVSKHYSDLAKQKVSDRVNSKRDARYAKEAAERAKEVAERVAQDEWLKKRLQETASRNTRYY